MTWISVTHFHLFIPRNRPIESNLYWKQTYNHKQKEASKNASIMSNLKKIQDENRESKFGYVYAVSGPGKWQSHSRQTETEITIE